MQIDYYTPCMFWGYWYCLPILPWPELHYLFKDNKLFKRSMFVEMRVQAQHLCRSGMATLPLAWM